MTAPDYTFVAIAYVATEDGGEFFVKLTENVSVDEATEAIDKLEAYLSQLESPLKMVETELVQSAKTGKRARIMERVRIPKDMKIDPYRLEVWNSRATDLGRFAVGAIETIIFSWVEKEYGIPYTEIDIRVENLMETPLCRLPHGLRIILAPLFDLYLPSGA